MKLISMTNYVLELGKTYINDMSDDIWIARIIKYANFLKQPLKLDMFVPCDEDGNVLEAPVLGRNKEYDAQDTSIKSIIYHENLHKQIKIYQQAKERCLFEGFEVISDDENHLDLEYINVYIRYDKESELFLLEDNTILNIEDVTQCNLILTQSAINQFNLK